MASEASKRRKIDDEAPLLGTRVSLDGKNVTAAAINASGRMVAAQTSGINLAGPQNKYFAITQAQQDGCTGNYRIFDSPYGNFLVPGVPTHAELA
ncbi:hypothetical protein P8452_18786 [Trifolium repens]|nr:hypothetical protein QL285_059490 [Trifolium repens]WJX30223.1 hypothetical protein P8452_18786 [Trifolium repens]